MFWKMSYNIFSNQPRRLFRGFNDYTGFLVWAPQADIIIHQLYDIYVTTIQL